jgi:hypothetical protein
MEGSDSLEQRFAEIAGARRFQQLEQSMAEHRLTIRVLTAPGYPKFSTTTATSMEQLEELIRLNYGVQRSGKPHFWSTEPER